MWKTSLRTSDRHTGDRLIRRNSIRLLSDRRGVSITEAVVVIPFFLIVWMGMITVHRVYEKRLEAQVMSASRAIQMSVQGCSGHSVQVQDPNGEIPDTLEIQGGGSSWFEDISGDQPFAWTHTSGGTKRTAKGIPELFGGPTRSVRANQEMLCNMRPQEGLWDMLINLINAAIGND